jgi:hypothetical protein
LVWLALLAWFDVESIRAVRSLNWPQTGATIIQSAVVEGRGKHAGRYYVELQYDYQVGSETFHASRLMFGAPWYGSESEAGDLAGRFHIAAPVPVRYSASFPEVSVLLPGELSPNFSAFGFAFGGGFLVVLCFGIALYPMGSNLSIEGTSSGKLRMPPAAPHVKR